MKKFNWSSAVNAFLCGLSLSASLFSYKKGDYLFALLWMVWLGVNAVAFTADYYRLMQQKEK